jgi:hypothetical protein
MKRILPLLLGLILVSCTTLQPAPLSTPTLPPPLVLEPEENPYAPKLEDVSLKQDAIILTSTNLSERYDLTPIRAQLYITGSMPNVCSQLRIKVNPPDRQYQIKIEVYSVTKIKQNCNNVFQQFEVNLLLGQYSPGQYSVWINDNPAGTLASY